MNDEMKGKVEAIGGKNLDAILVSEEAIVPSSGFLSTVMERVHDEARMPAPIPFPWKRAIPGFVLIVAVFGWVGVEFVRRAALAAKEISFAAPRLQDAFTHPPQPAGWVALALGLSLASWLVARRFAGRSGLL
jgi:hypothetical protein